MPYRLDATFAGRRSEVARARAMATAALRCWGLDTEIPAIELAVSELVARAVRAGDRPVRVVLTGATDRLRLEVHAGPPVDGVGDPLWFVDDVADERGTTAEADGVVTWMVRRVARAPWS